MLCTQFTGYPKSIWIKWWKRKHIWREDDDDECDDDGSKLALESERLPPLCVEHIKNWNMYLILVVKCSFLYFWVEVLAINSFSNSQEPFTITCRNLFRFWFFFAFPLICVSFLSTLFEGQQQQQSQQFLHHFKFNFNAHDFEIRTRGRGFFACHSARWKPK